MTFRILRYLLLNKRTILTVTLIVAAVALIYVIFADSQYRADTLLMPPMEEGTEGLLSAWMAQLNLPSMVVPMSAGSMTAAVLVDILESRRLAELVVEKLDLREWYKADSMTDAVRNLGSATSVSASSTGMISLSVRAREPSMALKIVNAYISGLDSLNHVLQFTRAESTMEFVGQQIEKYGRQLEISRGKIADFQKEHGIIDFEEQMRGAIDVAAGLKVRAVLAEIELELMREFATPDAMELKRREMEFSSLQKQLEKMMNGPDTDGVFVPLSTMPRLAQDYATLQRDLEVNERVHSLLLQRYEESGIDRARNTPSVQIVDIPRLPEKRAGLPRWLFVLVAAAGAFVWISLVLAWWGWFSLVKRGAEEEEAYREFTELLKKDFLWLRKVFRF